MNYRQNCISFYLFADCIFYPEKCPWINNISEIEQITNCSLQLGCKCPNFSSCLNNNNNKKNCLKKNNKNNKKKSNNNNNNMRTTIKTTVTLEKQIFPGYEVFMSARIFLSHQKSLFAMIICSNQHKNYFLLLILRYLLPGKKCNFWVLLTPNKGRKGVRKGKIYVCEYVCPIKNHYLSWCSNRDKNYFPLLIWHVRIMWAFLKI